VKPTRRRFLAAGVLGATLLAGAGWFRAASRSIAPGRAALGRDAEAIVAAIVPVMLDGVLPAEAPTRRNAVDETIAGVDAAIAGLPPIAQQELARLFTLLALAPVRVALLHSSGGWPQADGGDVQRFLERMRSSDSSLLRSAYDAIHQLIFAAWYGNPRAWAAIGYSGPPQLS
jgi:hypothetical protein